MKKSAAVVAGAILALGGAAPAFADSGANSHSSHSPGFISGNTIQIPIHAPINACGNTVDFFALLNPAFGEDCVNR